MQDDLVKCHTTHSCQGSSFDGPVLPCEAGREKSLCQLVGRIVERMAAERRNT